MIAANMPADRQTQIFARVRISQINWCERIAPCDDLSTVFLNRAGWVATRFSQRLPDCFEFSQTTIAPWRREDEGKNLYGLQFHQRSRTRIRQRVRAICQ